MALKIEKILHIYITLRSNPLRNKKDPLSCVIGPNLNLQIYIFLALMFHMNLALFFANRTILKANKLYFYSLLIIHINNCLFIITRSFHFLTWMLPFFITKKMGKNMLSTVNRYVKLGLEMHKKLLADIHVFWSGVPERRFPWNLLWRRC